MILDRFKLTDRVAIVTGAGKGIGRGIALAFAEAGADVVCAARTEADIESTASEVRARGRRALAVRTDVLETSDLENLVDATLKEFGRLDLLVNNAGGTGPRAALDTSEERATNLAWRPDPDDGHERPDRMVRQRVVVLLLRRRHDPQL